MLDVSADQGTSTRCIRLVIVDRQPIVLQGLKSVFAAQHDFEIVASCSDGTSCLEAIRNFAPDVALLADTLPDLKVSEILAIAKAENLAARLVFFTESESDDGLAAAIAVGACSAISKYANPETMLRYLRLIAERSVSPEQSQDLSPNGKEAYVAKIEKMLGLLTQRERQVVRLVSEGMSNKEIARQLNVSQGTVKVHLHNVFQKLEINNRTVLATIALLQRQAGFGTLALAALAFAIADDLKASDANNAFPNDDDSTTYKSLEHAGFESWKKAILRHVVGVDPGETVVRTQRSSFTKVSQVTNSAMKIEALHAPEQVVLSNLGRGYGPIGSSTPYLLASPLLQAINNTQIGSPSAQQQFPPPEFASNPMKSHGGYGTFTTAAVALIYALDDSHAAVHSLGPGEARLSATDSNSTQSDTTIDFASGQDRINLAAFGALAFLHLTSASKSVPPHTLAWIYNPAINETIVYVNPTDRSLDIGDADLVEIHLQAVVSVAESDFVYQSAALEGIDAALRIATASDGTVPTTYSVHASVEAGPNESTLSTAGVWTIPADDGLRFHFGRERIGSNVSARLISFGDHSAYATEESDSAASVSAHVSSIELAHSNATVWAEEDPTFKKEPIHANTGALSTGHGNAHAITGLQPFEFGGQSAAIAAPVVVAEPIETSLAPGNSAGHDNSQQASEAGSAVGAIEPIETSLAPGNSAGHGNSQHASEAGSAAGAAEPIETSLAPGNSASHGNSQQASEAGSAIEPIETSLAPGNSAGHGNSQQASESASAAGAVEPIETSLAPGNSAGHDNSQHASEAGSAVGAVEPIETSLAPGNSAGHGNSQNAPQSAAINVSDGAQAAAAASETGGADQELAFHFNNPAPSTPTAVVELEVLNDPPVLLGHDVELGAILKVGPTAVEEHATGHVNSGQPHAAVPLSHDLLI